MIQISLTGNEVIHGRLNALAQSRWAFIAANAAARSFQAETRKTLKQQERKSRIPIRWRFSGSGAMTYTKATHAPRIEFGTGLKGPHHQAFSIEPRKKNRRRGKHAALKLPGGVFVRRIIAHPGAPACPFFFKDMESRKLQMLASAKMAIGARLRKAHP